MMNPATEKKIHSSFCHFNIWDTIRDLKNVNIMQAIIFVCGIILARTTLFGFYAYGISFVAVHASDQDILPAALGVALSSLLFSDLWTVAAVSVFVFWIATGKKTPLSMSEKTVSLILLGLLLCALYFLKASTFLDYIIFSTEIILSFAAYYIFEKIDQVASNFITREGYFILGQDHRQKKRIRTIAVRKNNQIAKTNLPNAITREDMICAALFCSMLIMGLCRLSLPISLALIFSGFLTVVTGYLAGMGTGTIMGLVTGVAMAGAGFPVAILSSMGVLGFVCGIFRVLKRPLMITAFSFCALALYFFVPSSGLLLPELCIICAAVLLCPRPLYTLMAQIVLQYQHRQKHVGEDIKKIKKDTRLALFNVASVLEKMADTLSCPFAQRFDVDALAQQTASDVCAICPNKLSCWRDPGRRYTDMLRFTQDEINHGNTPPKWNCQYPEELAAALHKRMGKDEETMETELKRSLARKLLQEQLIDAGSAVKELADQAQMDTAPKPDIPQALAQSLSKIGFRLKSLDISSPKAAPLSDQWEQVAIRKQMAEQNYRITLRFSNPPEEKMYQRILKCVEDVCGCEMDLDARGKRGLFFKTKALTCHGTAISCPAPRQTVCGDNYAMFYAGEKRILCISDGMGNGLKAFQESDAVISLIRAFLEAGYDKEAMIRAINTLLMMREEETFATLDLCLMDMVTGKAEFIKAGAASSYILRKGAVREINGPSLPVGILREMRPAIESCILEPGDVIVMVSDGVADVMGPVLPQWLSAQRYPVEDLSCALLDQAQKTADNAGMEISDKSYAMDRDDMTVLAILIQ